MKIEKVFRLITFTAIVAATAMLASCTLDDNTQGGSQTSGQTGGQTGGNANPSPREIYAETRITGFNNAGMVVINAGGKKTYQEFYTNMLNLKKRLLRRTL